MTDCILAIDAGGTVFKYALITLDGAVRTEVFKLPINSKGSKSEILDSYKRLIDHAGELSDNILGVGISTPGPFDYDSGTSYMKHKFETIYGIPLKQKIKDLCGKDIPVWFCPDTNAFLAGEYAYGAGRNSRNAIGITIGTGLGIAVIKDGKMCLNDKKGPKEVIYNLPCDGGILEDYVSGRGIAEYYKCLSSAREERITAKDVGMLAEVDDNAKKTFDDIGYLLGKALTEKVDGYNAEMVILGGQVANSFSFMYSGIMRGIAREECKIIKAEDIDNAAIKGVLELKEMYC